MGPIHGFARYVVLTIVCGWIATWAYRATADDKPAPDTPAVAELRKWTHSELPKLFELYKHFHMHPELSLYEKETAARVASEWKAAGFDVTTGIGGHGVVAILKNGK